MAEVDVQVRAVGREAATAAETPERFLSPGRLLMLGVFALVALTFDGTEIEDDGVTYYDFLRRLFGADVPAAAYQFGSSFWNAPFYLVSQGTAAAGGLNRYHAGAVSIAIASNVAVVVVLYLGWRILQLLLTLFGTPLFFYGVVRPSYKHAADTLYATAACFFLLRSTQPGARRRDFVALGVCFALLLATRYANVALLIGGVGTLLAFRYVRAAGWALSVAVLVSLVIFAIPVVRHIHYMTPPNVVGAPAPAVDAPAWAAGSERLALVSTPIIEPVARHAEFKPLVPVYMLFTLHRGIFVWTPLTAFAAVGFVLLLRRDRQHRVFLAVIGVSALALLLIHMIWGKSWDGGGSFSQRFLTALFPLFLIGTAEFVRRTRAIGIAVLAVCVAWSVWIGLVQFNGYFNESARDSVVQIVQNYTGHYHHGMGLWSHQVRERITDRWQLYWRLVT
jgi:hypothetical protein